jgi:UDP-N-acetylmuramate dehydrogenase
VRVLGGGSNLLFTRDFDGTLVQLALTEIEEKALDHRFVEVFSGAGVVWNDLVQHTVRQGLGGLENLTLIWGWVGAAPMQNIGAYGVEVKDTITEVHTLEVATGNVRVFSPAECKFGYRESVFKHELAGKYWITGVRFKLDKLAPLRLSYGDIQKTLADMEVSEPTIAHVSAAVAAIRTAKLPDPRQVGNAGSFFKNPEIEPELAAALQAKHPLMPSYPAAGGRVKVPAGWLIEQAGWKGYRRGAVGVHPKQALVLVHYGGGTGHEILQLAQDIRADVLTKFGIELTPEVNII